MTNFSVIYYATIALCGLLGEFSTNIFLQVGAVAIALALALGKVALENMVSYDR